MPSAVAALSQMLNSRPSRRLTKLLLGGLVAFWLLDHIIFLLTDYQWFASLGYQDVLLSRWGTQAGIFAAFCGFCLLLTVAVMRTVLKPAAGEEPRYLNGSLRRLEPVRAVALRWSWGLLLVWLALLARSLAQEWPTWSQLLQNKSMGFAVPYYGLDAGFWVYWLPFLEHLLSVLWRYSVLLFLLAAVAGVLRALPLVAARHPVTPVKFNRALMTLVVWLLTLRAAGYALAFFGVARERFDGAGLFLARPLDILGAGACLGLAVAALVLHKPRVGRIWWPGWGFVGRVAVVFLLPSILDFCLSPIWNRVGAHTGIEAARKAASIKAWHLDFAPYAPEKAPIPERVWPVWDEPHVLQSIQNQRAESGGTDAGNKIPQWRTAVIEAAQATQTGSEANWTALVAGIAAGEEMPSSPREVGGQSRVIFGEVSLSSTVDPLKSPRGRDLDAPLLYGYEGRTLVNGSGEQTPPREPLGLDARSWWSKLAWSWRFRDIMLPGEAAGARELIVFRGVEERARMLWPELTPAGEPRPVMRSGRAYWVLNLVNAGQDFPGSYRPESGPLAGFNSASERAAVIIDAHSGKVEFVPHHRSVNRTPISTSMGVSIQENFLPALREAQAQVLAKAAGMKVLSASTPLFLESGLARVVLLAGEKQGQLLVEQAAGPFSEVRMWPITGNVPERTEKLHDALNVLTHDLSRKPAEDGLRLEAGSPVVWPDAIAPGGWWIAQAHYAVPDPSVTITENKDRRTRLQSMAITGASGEIGVGRSWSEAVTEWQANQRVIPIPKKNEASTEQLAATALRFHAQAQKAFDASRWDEFGRYSDAERKVLEQLAGRK